jgi:N-methylhydantoinase B
MDIDLITQEIVGNALISVTEEMGITLKRASYSANIKERNDFSCVLFDEGMELISQAEQIPVHLGSMMFSAKKAIGEIGMENVGEGDMLIFNDPYCGGTHLPDITLISPVYCGGRLISFVANRAHHVDVGGIAPGSMSSHATEVSHEGIRIPPVRLYKGGELQGGVLNLILANTRTPENGGGDIRAQVASIRVGKERVLELERKYGLGILKGCMEGLIDYSERMTRAEIEKLPDGEYEFQDYMEGDGIEDRLFKIRVKVIIDGSNIRFDFSNTSEQAKGPINAPEAVTASAVYYVVRCITGPQIPANAGFAKPIGIITRKGTLVHPEFPAPVAGGNVETSQRIVDVLLGALAKAVPGKIPAASCGSMTNISLGGIDSKDGRIYTYYETIGGGMGARPYADGVDGVHTHMTNTQNTPIEALEMEFPLRVEKYEFRPKSGGQGEFRGGCGIERAIRLLRGRAKLSILAERFTTRPYGLLGGLEGEGGSATTIRNNGREVGLKSKDEIMLEAGDLLIVDTPGGGGYGNPSERDSSRALADIKNGLILNEEGSQAG